MKKIFTAILIALFLVASFPESSFAENKAKTLSDLISLASANNPQIKAAYEQWQSAQEKISVVSGLPDPQARYTYFGRSVETRVGPQEHKYGISQTIPFPGKLNFKNKSQSKQAQILKQKYDNLRQQIIKEIRFAYYDLFYVEQAISITEQEKSDIEQVEKIAKSKYQIKKATQQDVFKAQLELTYLISKIVMLKQNKLTLLARIRKMTGQNSKGFRVSTDFADILKDGQLPEIKKDPEQLYEQAIQTNQDLQIARLDKEKAEYEKTLAKFSYAPDLTLGFDYIQVGSGSTNNVDDGKDAWMGTVAVNVPLWAAKQHSMVNEQNSRLREKKQNLKNSKDYLRFSVEESFYKLSAYKETADLYESALIPQAEQSLLASKTGYETGKISFIEWLDSERMLLKTKLAYYQTVAEYLKTIAYLDQLVGKSF